MNSSFHSLLVEKILRKEKYEILRKEVRIGESRIDFLVAKNGKDRLLEVKGCTLVKGKVALFLDALTERGLKHIKTLGECGGRSIVSRHKG